MKEAFLEALRENRKEMAENFRKNKPKVFIPNRNNVADGMSRLLECFLVDKQ